MTSDLPQDEVATFIQAYLREGDTVVDIGANIGRYTLLASQLVRPKGRVWAFEPTPSAFQALEANLKLNACKNVKVLRLAVAEKSGLIHLWDYRSFSNMNSIFPQNGELASKRIDCGAISGAEILGMVGGYIDLLKIDVEGAELPVLRGFDNRLADVGCVIFECSLANYRRAGYSIGDVLGFLNGLGWQIYEFNRKGRDLCRIHSLGYETINKNLIAVSKIDVFQSRAPFEFNSQ
jgi:FkbM family methyltransferase